MKRLFGWIAVCLGVGAILLAAGYVIALMASDDTPDGQFASFALLPHASEDLLKFQGGRVIWVTCCGTEEYGTYAQEASGRWIWSLTRQVRRGKDPALWTSTPIFRLVLRPGHFGLEVEPEDRSFPSAILRRRLFAAVDL